MIYSKTTEYALRALCFLTQKMKGPLTSVKSISQELSIPQAYLAKVFQCMVQAKVLKSSRGPMGGFKFLKSPSQISILDVINLMDNVSSSPLSTCVMGFEKCDNMQPCYLHPIWLETKEKILERLSNTSLLKLADLMQNNSQWLVHESPQLSRRMRKVLGVDEKRECKKKF